MDLWLETLPTPLGDLLAVSDDQAVLAVDFADGEPRMLRLLQQHWGADVSLRPAARELPARRALRRYFDGDLRALDALPVRTAGTSLQRSVWQALRTIPVGATTSYGALAQQLGRPRASRAVGMANARNPVALIVPCHRVIGSDGALTGYAGGLERKRWLLAHERARLPSC
jgi:methylated-DNA-[protein]-cysteine S-methyltransferase